MPPLSWTHPVCAYTLFVVAIAVLSQITLKSRQRIRAMETEFRISEVSRDELKGEIEALKEEMKRVREMDREEKLCLVETVKRVLQRSEGFPEEIAIEEAYSGSEMLDNVSEDADGKQESVVVQQGNERDVTVKDDISCPWCSHAHTMGLGDCSGIKSCDGSVHIPYCPSCFYKERTENGKWTVDRETTSEDEKALSTVAVLID